MAELMDRKRLIDYLPRFMQNFSELKELLNAANDETDRIGRCIGDLLDEAFISDCTEYGLRKYENLLHIIPDENEPVETRKMRVLVRWYDYAPYTYRVLVNRLNMICGVNNYNLQPDPKNYYFKIQTEMGTYGSIDELAHMLESILPQNIFCDVVNVLNIEAECSLNYGGGTCSSASFLLTEDWKQKQNIAAELSVGGGMVFSEKMVLTEDYRQEGVTEGGLYVTGAAVVSEETLVTNDFEDSAVINGEAGIAAGIVQAEFFEIKT